MSKHCGESPADSVVGTRPCLGDTVVQLRHSPTLAPAVVGQVDGADGDRAAHRDLTAPPFEADTTETSPGTAGEHN